MRFMTWACSDGPTQSVSPLGRQGQHVACQQLRGQPVSAAGRPGAAPPAGALTGRQGVPVVAHAAAAGGAACRRLDRPPARAGRLPSCRGPRTRAVRRRLLCRPAAFFPSSDGGGGGRRRRALFPPPCPRRRPATPDTPRPARPHENNVALPARRATRAGAAKAPAGHAVPPPFPPLPRPPPPFRNTGRGPPRLSRRSPHPKVGLYTAHRPSPP